MEGGRSEKRLIERLTPPKEDRSESWAEWRHWLREDFLRAWFVGGVLAWDGLGAVQIRYVLDPWYPGQETSPAYVYAVILGFLIVSTIGQVFLYRRLWPSPERRPARSIVSLAALFGAVKRGLRWLVRRSPAGESKPPPST